MYLLLFFLKGDPTNFGLSRSKEREWSGQIVSETGRDFDTTYSASYMPVPSSARVYLRFATPREVSTPLHRQNNINKNMHYRGTQKYLSPEAIGTPATCGPAPVHAGPMSGSIVY